MTESRSRSPIARVTSESMGFASKERPRNGIFGNARATQTRSSKHRMTGGMKFFVLMIYYYHVYYSID